MKRLIQFQLMLVLLLVCGQATIQAKRISQWQAQQQAYSFWGKQMPMKAKAKSRVVSTASLSTLGDDAVAPVLGYTSTGAFDANNLPEGLKDLLKSYEQQIAALGKTIRQMLLRQEPNLLEKNC